MEVKISKDIDMELKKVSENLGFNKQKIIEKAILFYLNNVKKQTDLNREFNEFDELSDEALFNFEKSEEDYLKYVNVQPNSRNTDMIFLD